jgi:hypothetical protein
MKFTPRSLSPWGNSPGYPLKKWLREFQNQSPYFGEEKNLFLLPGIEKRFTRFSWSQPGHYTNEVFKLKLQAAIKAVVWLRYVRSRISGKS